MKKILNSSTSSSSINIFRISFKLVLFIYIFLTLNHFIGIQLENFKDETNAYATIKWKEFYGLRQDKIDAVFIGSSHAYRSFDPAVFDQELGINSFNMGSPLQKPVESYYVLKETLKYQRPSVVVFDVYWNIFNKEKYFNSKVWNFDNMKFSSNKIGYLINVFDQEQYFSAMFKSVRYHDSTNQLVKSYIQEDTAVKDKDERLKTYLKNYKGKGFVIDNSTVELNKLEEKVNEMKNSQITFTWNKEQLECLYKIIQLCKKNKINLVLVTAPLAPSYFEGLDAYGYDYDAIHREVTEVAQNNQLLYIDYNLLNRTEKIVTDKDYSDTNHLNYTGSQKISLDLVKRLKKERILFK